jgi:hypothetical protein
MGPNIAARSPQTADYARASFTAAGLKDIEVDKELASRMSRQGALERPDPPTVRVLLDEGVLDHRVGSPEVMRAQLTRLLEVSKLH